MSLFARVHLTPCRVSMQSSELNYTVNLLVSCEKCHSVNKDQILGQTFSPFYQVINMCVSVIIFQCPGDKSLLFKQTARLFLVTSVCPIGLQLFLSYHQITILISNLDFHPATIKHCHPSLPISQLVQFPQNNHLCIVMALLCRSICVFYYTSLNCSK